MNTKTLKSVLTQVYRRYPEINGIKPKIRVQRPRQGQSMTVKPLYLLTFHNISTTANKKSLSRWVRVTINEQGKIIKIITSR